MLCWREDEARIFCRATRSQSLQQKQKTDQFDCLLTFRASVTQQRPVSWICVLHTLVVISDSANCNSDNTVKDVSSRADSVLKTSLGPDAADPDPNSWASAFGSDFVSLDTWTQHTTTDVETPPAFLDVGGLSVVCSDSVSLAAA